MRRYLVLAAREQSLLSGVSLQRDGIQLVARRRVLRIGRRSVARANLSLGLHTRPVLLAGLQRLVVAVVDLEVLRLGPLLLRREVTPTFLAAASGHRRKWILVVVRQVAVVSGEISNYRILFVRGGSEVAAAAWALDSLCAARSARIAWYYCCSVATISRWIILSSGDDISVLYAI